MDRDELPQLNNPWLLAAFDGWNDAAEAATGLVGHLVDEWDADLLADLDPEEYYDFQVVRPVIARAVDGTALLWPSVMVRWARPRGGGRDVLLLTGPEPNYRWKKFCAEILDLAQGVGVSEIVVAGALLADVPHTRPVPISATLSDEERAARVAAMPSQYSGPVGINTVLIDAAQQRGLTTASIWAAVPHYLADPPCPKATLALLGVLEDILADALPQGVLPELTEAWQRGAEELTERDDEIAEYVEGLESDLDASELPEASGDAIAREFERFLRRRGTDSGPDVAGA